MRGVAARAVASLVPLRGVSYSSSIHNALPLLFVPRRLAPKLFDVLHVYSLLGARCDNLYSSPRDIGTHGVAGGELKRQDVLQRDTRDPVTGAGTHEEYLQSCLWTR